MILIKKNTALYKNYWKKTFFIRQQTTEFVVRQ